MSAVKSKKEPKQKKEPKPKKEKVPKAKAATKNKRQKRDPEVILEEADNDLVQSTKSTLATADTDAIAEQNDEESKVEGEPSASNVAGQDALEETKKQKPPKKPKATPKAKKGRNKTKVVPSVADGDFIGDSDDEAIA